MMKRRTIWLILIITAALTAFALFSTEANYLAFIDALRSIKLTLQEATLNAADSDETVRLQLVLMLENPNAENVFLEEINYRLCTGTQFARVCHSSDFLGNYYSTVGSGKIAKGQLSLPIEDVVNPYYRERLEGADTVNVLGDVRMKFQIGDTELKFRLGFKGLISWPS